MTQQLLLEKLTQQFCADSAKEGSRFPLLKHQGQKLRKKRAQLYKREKLLH